ncbi:hypothetical protein DIZ81_11120 [Legionella taurinensis]|uniref:Membrane integrity-associated transporter subunit PqiC n=1 Tax=Legionella taurinensis TaxID=70611 RepID=A0A3A5L3Z5_9GAMM|nr:PqiC family protein [Legionella taurinensis]MDX1838402.1 PqiC family protein [Legionella taurinensis]PUT39158.1 hypothetical protein DB744_11130 [Legionella taurinensis]PUT39783.1 hypothetical protein DB746_13305 [Legionella taurinensis]PUT43614.1 hypothetical protein DB743_10520 [Legionella taurinensis]PUT45270.1 hypothetical protein DB745_13245 [Legionella taurinensis]
MRRAVGLLLSASLILTACSRSKDPSYYVLNPVSAPVIQSNQYIHVRLGIERVSVPDYLDKPQLSIYYTPNLSELQEDSQWAEEVRGNVKRVIKTNLSTFLSGALVELAPWDIKYKPNYQLQVDISQYKVTAQGQSILQAEYVIYKGEEPFKKYKVAYTEKLSVVNPNTMVISMNNNLTRLTRDIARHLPRA